MAFILRKFRKEKTDDSTCGTRKGIKCFNDSETGIFVSNIGMKLDNKIVEVRINKTEEFSGTCDSLEQPHSSKSGSGASSTCDESDVNDSEHDCIDAVEIREGIKVAEIKHGTYCHGFGLRDDDIILSVNERPVTSAALVFIVVQRIIDSSKASKLRLEIHRKGKGLIVLDNGGDDLYDWDDDELTWIDSTTNTIKSVKFTRYLIVKSNGTIALTKFKTPQKESKLKLFVIRRYVKTISPEEEAEKRLVTLQHKTTGKYLRVDDGKLISVQEPPPEDGKTLPENSNYLFNVIHPINRPSDTTTEIFQPTNDNEHGIGFKNKKSSATLMATVSKGRPDAILLPLFVFRWGCSSLGPWLFLLIRKEGG